MRNIARCDRVVVVPRFEELVSYIADIQTKDSAKEEGYKKNLFVLTAMSNFCGRKYPMTIVERLQRRLGTSWAICLDAAALLGCSKLDLSSQTGQQPDFVVLSFYKIFGYPTGLGALLVRRSSAQLLKKHYFGGGAVEFAGVNKTCVKYRDDISHR